MFFKLTRDKVVSRINRLIDELGTYDARIKGYEEDAKFAIRAGITKPSDYAEIGEWRAVYDGIYETLADARYAVGTGQADHAEIYKILPPVKSAIRNFKRVLDETDKLKAAGRSAAKEYFRNLDAQN